MKKERIRALSLCAGIWLAVLSLLFGLMVAAAAIPNEALRLNMEKSALYYSDKDAFSFTDRNKLNSIADNYADTILLGVAWNMGEGDPLSASLDTKYYDGGELGESYGLYLSVTEGTPANTDYTRYWHGTAAFIRPLHLVTDVSGVKAIGFALILALCAVTLGILIARRHADLAVMLALSLCAIQIWDLRLSMEYQPAFLIAFVFCILYLLLERRGDGYLTLLSVASGAAVCFFDFLTAETVTVLLPLVLTVAVRASEGRLGERRDSVALLAKCGGGWLASYAASFLAKWTAATAVTGENAFAEALRLAGERIGGETVGAQELPRSVFSSVVANLAAAFGSSRRIDYPVALLPVLIASLALVSVWYLFRAGKGERFGALILLLLGALVPIRFLVLNNHSFMHCFFTYRALAPTLFACLAATWLNIDLPRRRPRSKNKNNRIGEKL